MTTDQIHDDWEPLDWDTNPARIGDEVEITDKFCGVTYVKSGVIVSFNDYYDPCAATNGRGVIGVRGQGTWRVRRKRLDPLAENYGKVLRNVKMDSGEEADVAVLSESIGLLADWSGGHAAKDPHWITDFITDDHTTRYVRHGNTWTAETLNGETND